MFSPIENYKTDYECLKKVGSGKFGTVFQVRSRPKPEDIFAAKHIKYLSFNDFLITFRISDLVKGAKKVGP